MIVSRLLDVEKKRLFARVRGMRVCGIRSNAIGRVLHERRVTNSNVVGNYCGAYISRVGVGERTPRPEPIPRSVCETNSFLQNSLEVYGGLLRVSRPRTNAKIASADEIVLGLKR